ncbi:hypothetical protein ACFUTU_08610 [Arthrobacter sp. NPDC057388]|uniref:hypothetical protein n=1 Tax=Arthrobacter sp. NPDC057388 TaxID=3346116 RepID=UPI0036384689
MSENPDVTGADRDEPARDEPGREAPDREDMDLSTKLDPDFIPQQGDTPEVQRAREHPEETGS